MLGATPILEEVLKVKTLRAKFGGCKSNVIL